MELPSFSVEGKATIVTGASRGIGNCLAKGFAEAGARVALVARTVEELEATAEEIRSRGGTAIAVPTDVTKRDQVERMVRVVLDRFGRIDVLLNVAGGAGERQLRPPLEIEEDFYDELLDRNLKSVFLVNQAVAREMARQGWGSIINFSSLSGTKPVPLESVAGAAKAGVNHLTRAWAAALGPYGVRVNAIAPGSIMTDALRLFLDEASLERMRQLTPMKRLGETEDVALAALYLASPRPPGSRERCWR